MEKGYGDSHAFIKQFKEGTLQLQPGCDMEQTLEANVTGVLNNIREQAGKVSRSTYDTGLAAPPLQSPADAPQPIGIQMGETGGALSADVLAHYASRPAGNEPRGRAFAQPFPTCCQLSLPCLISMPIQPDYG